MPFSGSVLAVVADKVETPPFLKIHQTGVQWKQGVVIYMLLHTSSLHNTKTHPLHPLLAAPPCNEYPEIVQDSTANLRTKILDFRGL